MLRVKSPQPHPRPVLVDDAALARAVMRGEQNASVALWDQYSPFVRRLLLRVLGGDDEIEDMVQDVFLSLHRSMHTLRDPQALRAFLMQVTTRVAASVLRRRKLRRWLRLTEHGTVPDVAVDDGHARAAMGRLMRILDTLDTEERLAFVLHRVEELDLRETAGAMNVSLATVKRRIARADEQVSTIAVRDPLLQAYVTQRGGASDEP
jgi:RNA polymerase sigma-70 factor (ECF subfamily)